MTPIRSFIAVLLLSLAAFIVPAGAQTTTTNTTTPTPAATSDLQQAVNDGVHVDLAAAYSIVNSAPTINGNDSISASVITARVPITDRFALRYQMINLPSSTAQINLGEIEYRRSVADFLKSPALRIDPSKYDVFGYGGLGGKRQDGSTTAAFSYIVGGGLDYKLTDNVAVRVVDVAYVRSNLDKKGLLLSNHFQFAPGISLRF